MKKEARIPVMRCTDCNALAIPPQYVCRQCSGTRLAADEIGTSGELYTYTTIRVAPAELKDQAPYRIAVVTLADGLRVTARLSGDPESPIQIGQKAVFEKVDEQGYWFRAE